MPVALRLLAPLMMWLRAWAMLALAVVLVMVIRPALKSLTHPKGSIVKRVAAAPAATLAKALVFVERQCEAAVSHQAVASLGLLTRWLAAAAVLARTTYMEYARLAEANLTALGVLRHETLPRVAHTAAAPALQRAKVADRTARRSISLTRREASERRRSIDRLRKAVGPLAGIVAGIDVLVRGRHAARHHADHARTIPRIRDRDIPRLRAGQRATNRELGRTRSRLRRLEQALALGAIGALMYRILARVAPWLFCRNWKRIGPRMCAVNPSYIDDVFALLLTAEAIAHLPELVRVMQSVTRETAEGIRDLAGV